MRRVFFWSHLCAGLVAGAVSLVMSVTGVLLTYERQITEWADGYRVAPLAPGAARLGVEALTARVRDARGAWPTVVTLRADPQAPAAFSMGRAGTVFVNPWTGKLLGEGSRRARAFFRAVTDWHRWLGADGGSRWLGKAVTGASNLIFLFIVLSGVVLWWPKGFSARQLAPVTVFQGGLAGKARDFNWHNVFGFWSALPLVLVVTSGVVISYPWANDLVQRLTGTEPPRRPSAAAPAPVAPGGPRVAEMSYAGLDAAWARAEAQVPGWQSLTLRAPQSSDAPWTFSIDTSTSARRPSTRSQLVVDRKTGEVVRYEPYSAVPLGRRVTGWLRFIHTGEAFGIGGQTIAGLASLGAVMLAWTGVSLALRRFAAWRQRRARVRVAAVPDGATIA